MYKTPLPEENEEHERPEITYPAQRRRSAIEPKRPATRPSERYHSDEHPEIPKIKRASLQREQQEEQSLSDTTPDQETHTHASEQSKSTSSKGPRTGKTPVTSKEPATTHVPRASTRSPYRERAGPWSAHAPQPFIFGTVRQMSRKQVVTILGILILIVLLLIPLNLLTASHSQTGIASGSTTTTTMGNSQPPASLKPAPAGIHELVIVPQDTDHPPPPVLATSAYLLDADTGVTLYAHNPFMHLPMLSTTKLMTAVLAVEQQSNLDQRITITGAMSREIDQLSPDSAMFGIKKGEIYTLRDLLYSLLFVSGNDAAIAIADALAGNLHNFVAEMNQKARQLGMYDTHFMNPHGLLQTGQYSSAHDLALLGRYSMSLPVLHKISSEKAYHIPQGGNHPERFLLNENQFLWWYPGADGGKTGWDGQSDFIQVISSTRNHHHLVGVVMHTVDWWTDMRDLMNWGFDSFTWVSPRDVDAQYPIPFDDLWNYFARDTKDKTIPTADHGRYYIYTGFSISGPVMAYFDKNGGLKTFGYPTKLPAVDSSSVISQRFEHGTIQCNLTTNQCQKT